ncbi:MAG: DUF4469 domain-containing protein [Spirochaetaceae bacterium]|jgi:hypothetical protein|nr:DUF4469 domain-containing protein [Spirochaetaceae bacterium]
MALDFTVKDIAHKVVAKFVPAYLPEAKKPYYLKAVFQPELDIHEIASKAEVYNITTPPKVIEEGFNAACELIYCLLGDGRRIKTPLCTVRTRLPGEYGGSETGLAPGARPEAHAQAAPELREYIAGRVQVVFDGIEDTGGFIAEAVDESNGHVNTTMTENNILTIRGYGLKIDSDAAHEGDVGLTFESDDPAVPSVKAEVIAVNEPKTLKVVVPEELSAPKSYYLKIVTQSSAKGGGHLLKDVREMRSDFKLKAFKREAPAAGGAVPDSV